jgi:competence protein ComEC
MTYPRIETKDSETHTFSGVLGRWKDSLVARIETYVSSPASALASGMLFGTASMSQELTQTFRIAGLSHIIVLSGFNIAVLIAAILFVLGFLPLVVRIMFASGMVILFVMMVGAEASVIRATLMALVSLLAMLIGRAYVARQALMLSLVAIVIYEPYALLHDVSLHLSFLATAGIVYASAPLLLFFRRYIPRVPALHEMCATTIAAYVGTLPYIMYTFGTVSVYALIANMLVLPFVSLAMLLTFLVVLSSYLSTHVALLFGLLNTLLNNFMISIARMIEYLPFSSFLISISFSAMCTMYICVAFAVAFLIRKQKDETHTTNEDGVLTDTISY